MPSIPAPDVRRWAGIAALAVAVLLAVESITKLTMGPRPALDDTAALVTYIQSTSAQTIISRVLPSSGSLLRRGTESAGLA